ncbi:MAG: acireductone synthase [Myxococcales bacterium]|nr:acireductone synthase [Myxococcales bacterium]
MTIEVVLLDIEGTTTAKSFVFDVLFPYARAHLESYVAEHRDDPRVREILRATRQTVRDESGAAIDDERAVQTLLRWIDADRKHTALKTLQGYIWRSGYESGAYRAHLYADVVPALDRWLAAGLRLAIYSSGSVEAQQLLFAHTEEGDLRDRISAYFDTRVGQKRDAASYRTIAETLGVDSSSILFLSDVTEELDAASIAGLQVVQVVRPGTEAGLHHPVIADFSRLVDGFSIAVSPHPS